MVYKADYNENSKIRLYCSSSKSQLYLEHQMLKIFTQVTTFTFE